MPKPEALRGLMMMKCNIEAHCIDSIDADQCHRIIEETEAKLQGQGFKG